VPPRLKAAAAPAYGPSPRPASGAGRVSCRARAAALVVVLAGAGTLAVSSPAAAPPTAAPPTAASPAAASPAAARPAVPILAAAAVAAPFPPPPAPGAPPPAPADTAPTDTAPSDAAGAAARLEQVQHEAEALTEQWHAAQDDLTARRAELVTLRAAVDPARAAADAARGEEEGYRTQVDAVALTTFESGRLDTFSALLASGTPDDYLEQMSALEMISADQAAALDALTTIVERTRRARDDADAAAARARTAADDAERAEQELAARKRDADRLVDEAEALLGRLTPRERDDRLGPEVDAPALPSGTGAGTRALRAAAAQLGKGYRWGATGPASFDCSGLTSFAFRQAGITLPRSSSQQARVGRAVPLGDLQPGDLVFFYQPVSHVGIYAGDGKMIHAPQTGDVVRYQTVNRRTFSGARRL
jgi:cell wall-associated NlpC family hydrolase